MTDKIEIFISYSHKDERLRQRLGKYLKPLERSSLSVVWHDRKIGAGREWEGEIHMHLNTCHIILLLVSADFMASDYCNDVEVKRAIERHNNGEARVIPVILKPGDWKEAPFAKFQALPGDGRTVWQSSTYATEKAFCEAAEGIRAVVEELIAQPSANIMPSRMVMDSHSLHEALLTLDYQEQVRIFRQFIGDGRRVGAFLIHGELEHGQRWLLNRLVRLVPGSNVGRPPFKFEFQRQIGNRGLEALWRALGRWINPVRPPDSPQKIIEQVHALWQQQTLVFILDDLDMINEQCIAAFIKNFWEPLMDIAQRKPCPSFNHYLLMFLVDNTDCTDRWKTPFTEQIDAGWRPHVPIKLKKIAPFTNRVIMHWIDHEVNRLPPDLTVSNILNGSKKEIPQIVLERICELCGHDWYEKETEWVKKYG